MEIPDFSFAVTLYEYVNLMILPGLEAFIHYFIRDIILRPLVLPESITIPIVVRHVFTTAAVPAGGGKNCTADLSWHQLLLRHFTLRGCSDVSGLGSLGACPLRRTNARSC